MVKTKKEREKAEANLVLFLLAAGAIAFVLLAPGLLIASYLNRILVPHFPQITSIYVFGFGAVLAGGLYAALVFLVKSLPIRATLYVGLALVSAYVFVQDWWPGQIRTSWPIENLDVSDIEINHLEVGSDPALVRHEASGLVFQRCVVGMVWDTQSESCQGKPALVTYSSLDSETSTTRESVPKRARALLSQGWRLASPEELALIFFCSSGHPRKWYEQIPEDLSELYCNGRHLTPKVHPQMFPSFPGGAFVVEGEGHPVDGSYFLRFSEVDRSVGEWNTYTDAYAMLVRE